MCTLYVHANIIKFTHALNYMHMEKIYAVKTLGQGWRNYINRTYINCQIKIEKGEKEGNPSK